jgi:hypothetical protein
VGGNLPAVADLVVHKRVAGLHVHVLAILDRCKSVQAIVLGNRGAQDVDVLLCDGATGLLLHEPSEVFDLLRVRVQHLRPQELMDGATTTTQMPIAWHTIHTTVRLAYVIVCPSNLPTTAQTSHAIGIG